jgi:hypothetical protein
VQIGHISHHTIDDCWGIVYALGSKPLHVLFDLRGQPPEFIHAHLLPDSVTLPRD